MSPTPIHQRFLVLKPREAYLFFYNIALTLGWSAIFIKTARAVLIDGLTNVQIYEQIVLELQIFQTAAVCEILHSLVGFVRTPFITTFMQILSRLYVVWGILYSVPSSRESIGVPMVLAAWSITEVVRYSFYALNLANAVPYPLAWLRYSLFLILYPIGIIGEMLTMSIAFPIFWTENRMLFELPNACNFSLSAYQVLIMAVLLYFPFVPQLYSRMFAQRRKALRRKLPEPAVA